MSVLIARAHGILSRGRFIFLKEPFAYAVEFTGLIFAPLAVVIPQREFAWITLARAGCFALVLMAGAPNSHAAPDDFGDTVVYGVHHALDLGGKGERPKTDYFINMGARSGVTRGDVVEARRNTPSYDLLNRRLYKDMSFPIARLRIIHVERSMSVARLLRILPADETPAITPAAVMIGDSVRRLSAGEVKKELALAAASTRKTHKARAVASAAEGMASGGTNSSLNLATPTPGLPVQSDKSSPSRVVAKNGTDAALGSQQADKSRIP